MPSGFTKSPGRIFSTKLSSKITKVGNTNKNSNHRPAGPSKTKGPKILVNI